MLPQINPQGREVHLVSKNVPGEVEKAPQVKVLPLDVGEVLDLASI